jgi:ABC-type spermidine/putrescine transport system permease subunit I
MLKGVVTQDEVLRSLVTSISIATGIIFLGLGIDLKIKRYIIVGACGLLLSIIILIMQLPFSTSWLFFGIAWMIVLVFSGIWTLREYQITSKGFTND